MRRATSALYWFSIADRYFYPRSPCGERLFRVAVFKHPVMISIHALLAESDIRLAGAASAPYISIHALLAESDRNGGADTGVTARFLSTLSLRRATYIVAKNRASSDDFYPRSPCGERRVVSVQIGGDVYFYPRSPCGERPSVSNGLKRSIPFLSTLSLRRATPSVLHNFQPLQISIHALLAESDVRGQRPNWGGCLFLSTLSLRRATTNQTNTKPTKEISIHALLAESDPLR